jgi:Ras-related GTP-binding protein C/D
VLLTNHHRSFLSFIIYDAPGQLNFLELSFDITGIFDNIDTIIWVFDAQTEWVDALIRFHGTLMILKDRFPNMNLEVFIHKVEGMSDEYALEIKEDIIRRTEEELMDNERSGMAIRYHLTSIYDRTVWEALSRVVQRVTPRLNAVEGLLDSLCENTGMVKIFLFDLYSKLYVATDTSPVDMQILDTCTHHIEFVSEMESIFGYVISEPAC